MNGHFDTNSVKTKQNTPSEAFPIEYIRKARPDARIKSYTQ